MATATTRHPQAWDWPAVIIGGVVVSRGVPAPLFVMLLCRCLECGRQQSKDLATGSEDCGACGGRCVPDASYHPEHPDAVDFEAAPLEHVTPEDALERERVVAARPSPDR